MYIPVEIMSLIEIDPGSPMILLLLDKKENRILPISIGTDESKAIIMGVENIVHPRPLTHDLLRTSIKRLKGKIEKVMITEIKKNIFYAKIILTKDGKKISIDARPSDAIALVAGTSKKIYVNSKILDIAAHENPINKQEVKKVSDNPDYKAPKKINFDDQQLTKLKEMMEKARKREADEDNNHTNN